MTCAALLVVLLRGAEGRPIGLEEEHANGVYGEIYDAYVESERERYI